MKSHLTSGQISDWVLGARSRPITRHLHSCAVCQKEVARLEETLAQFRTSVRDWAETQFESRVQMPINLLTRTSRTAFRTTWAAVAVVFCVLLSLAVREGTRQSDGQPAGGDAALLNQVDREVARTVPGPMEPLLQLVAWDANSAQETSSDGLDQ
jgi:hypothetical protein